MPILIGGSGPHKTLPIVAAFADMWNPGAPTAAIEHVRQSTTRLNELCLSAGRSPDQIERTLDPVIIIRSTHEEAERALNCILEKRGLEAIGDPDTVWLGPPEDIAERFDAFQSIGFTHLIGALPAPYDLATIGQLSLVRELLAPSEARARSEPVGAGGRDSGWPRVPPSPVTGTEPFRKNL
jgi:alkanesulfonate monooxygenase SsuD/methylene tetrahydromethanopterin reductase-like flavin-dependent oxidoreductase (luciferase family)